MLRVETVDAVSTIKLMMALLTMYPRKRIIHLFLDNARYRHTKMVLAWLARPGCWIKLHFVPTYCPHLDPIERLSGDGAMNIRALAPARLRRRDLRAG